MKTNFRPGEIWDIERYKKEVLNIDVDHKKLPIIKFDEPNKKYGFRLFKR